MSNLADRVIKHVDNMVLNKTGEYDLVLALDYEIHAWIKLKEETCITVNLLKWMHNNNRKEGKHHEKI